MSAVWIAGGHQSDFSRNVTREGKDVADLCAELVQETLAAANVGTDEIGVIHVGNAFGQLFTGQGHYGALPATVEPGLWDVPATRHEGACASGGLAILAAMADLESGRYDTALVLGIELEKTVPGDVGARNMGAAAWVGHEGQSANFMWPFMFSELTDEYDRRFGLDEAHLRAIAELNRHNALDNPNAQTREWAPLGDDDPIVEGRLKKSDCGPLTDGAAGLVLVSDRFRADARKSRILGWGHRTVGLPLAAKFERSQDGPYALPHVRATVQDALRRAEVDDVDLYETHDCFTISEYMAIDHLGITAPGDAWKAIEAGELERDGRIPVNPSGGLIGGGHPVGATGVRMVLDAHKQVTGTAGGYQVDGARTAATLNIGGSTTTTVSFVVGL